MAVVACCNTAVLYRVVLCNFLVSGLWFLVVFAGSFYCAISVLICVLQVQVL